ncbi:MAG: hypothetical protein GXO78_00845 [Calditrichaeota bacterium]|nr:hypothetical protein [Calditrichota bacterium]
MESIPLSRDQFPFSVILQWEVEGLRVDLQTLSFVGDEPVVQVQLVESSGGSVVEVLREFLLSEITTFLAHRRYSDTLWVDIPLRPDVTYRLRLQPGSAVNASAIKLTRIYRVDASEEQSLPATPFSVQQPVEVPSVFALHPNYPNPFNPITTIAFSLPVRSRVRLQVFDVLGREVARLVDGVKAAGRCLRRSGRCCW